MNTHVSIKRRERTPHSPGFHLYVDAQDYDKAEVTAAEPPVYLQLDGVLLSHHLGQGVENVTIALPQDTARALGLLPRGRAEQAAGTASPIRPVARLLTAPAVGAP